MKTIFDAWKTYCDTQRKARAGTLTATIPADWFTPQDDKPLTAEEEQEEAFIRLSLTTSAHLDLSLDERNKDFDPDDEVQNRAAFNIYEAIWNSEAVHFPCL